MNEVLDDGNVKDVEKTIHKFGTQADKVLDIVINSLYTDKGIAIRELIANASDACERLRYKFSTDPSLVRDDEGVLQIVIKSDSEKSTVTIADNGLGMDKEELIKNLGVIARSGTESFVKDLEAAKSSTKSDFIGHFGVGFYASFMLADLVEVHTRKLGSEEAWCWTSDGKGEFSISSLEGEFPIGTSVVLHVKESEKEFLDKFKIEHVVTTYADHIGFPIQYMNDKGEYEQLNDGSALWCKDIKEVTQEQHRKFFQGVAHVGGDPWLAMHNRNEGSIEYINLLYIPSIKPFDLFHPDRKCAVKLYINKVFITETNIELIPSYMRFLKGVIDSSDLPLNISRETLQNNAVLSKIKHSVANRTIKELFKKAQEDQKGYNEVFWNNFGAVLKEGLCEFMPSNDRDKLFEVCRFYSAKRKELIALDDYVSDLREGQDNIYCLNASTLEAAASSPQMEGFLERGLDVLILIDPVDNFWLNVNSDYKGKKFMSVTRADSGLGKFDRQATSTEDDQVEVHQDEAKVQAVSDYIKKILGDRVSDVKASSKLVSSPVCLAVKEGAMDIRMEKFMIEQKQLQAKSSKILEINMNHSVISKLVDNIDTDYGKNIVEILFGQACILEGEDLDNPVLFRDSINRLVAG